MMIYRLPSPRADLLFVAIECRAFSANLSIKSAVRRSNPAQSTADLTDAALRRYA